MRNLVFASAALILGAGTALAIPGPMSGPVSRPTTAVTCFKSGEQVSGQNKICFYNCLGSEAAITISSISICPITINR